MDIAAILKTVDHTLLATTATWDEIKIICDDAIRWGTASVCIPPSYVERAARYCCGRMPVCTVIGFPNGYSTTAVKVFETRSALEDGAREIDMVINLGWVKEAMWEELRCEIAAVKEACGDHTLKVIVEACQLTQAEKIKLCEVVTQAGADFIKTSTGFSTGGAALEDVALFAAHIGPGVKIKAAGGIRTLDDARRFLQQGASRLGTSAIVKLVKEQEIAGR